MVVEKIQPASGRRFPTILRMRFCEASAYAYEEGTAFRLPASYVQVMRIL